MQSIVSSTESVPLKTNFTVNAMTLNLTLFHDVELTLTGGGGGNNYLWTGGMAKGKAINPAKSGNYTVTVTNVANYSNAETVDVFVKTRTLIINLLSTLKFTVFPNLSKGTTPLSYGVKGAAFVTVLDVLGKEKYRSVLTTTTMSLDLESLER